MKTKEANAASRVIEVDDALAEILRTHAQVRGVAERELAWKLLRDGITRLERAGEPLSSSTELEDAMFENKALHYLIGNRLLHSIESEGEE